MTIAEMVSEAHRIADEHGWHEEPRSIPELLCLVHSEVSESLESYRRGEPDYWLADDGKPEGIVAELADVLIRIGDMCGVHGWDLQRAVAEKMKYNEGRSYRHGGKRA